MTTPQAKPDDAVSRRQVILETAEQLFAERGIDAVSLNEINKASGQKNTSALHYHFGNREQLINAIIDQHTETLRQKLVVLLDGLDADPDQDVVPRKLVAAYLAPYAEQLNNARGGRYLQIMAQRLTTHAELAVTSRDTDSSADLRPRIQQMMQASLQGLSQADINARLLSFGLLMFTSLAAFNRLDEKTALSLYGGRKTFLKNLETNLVSIASAAPMD